MKEPNPCKKKQHIDLVSAIKQTLGVHADKTVSPTLKARFLSILSRANRAREEDAWYYMVADEKKQVRFESVDFHDETLCCVHIDDFQKWVEYEDTKSARRLIRCDLERLERFSIEELNAHGFNLKKKAAGLFQTGTQAEQNRFLFSARQVESSENATEASIVAARIALALPALWNDFRSDNPNPWVLSSRLAILCSAVPDPLAKERLLEDKEKEIEAMRPDEERGKKVLAGTMYAHEIAHGTKEEKKERWERYLKKCIKVADENKSWKLTVIRQHVADEEGVSLKTIQRYTRNLKDLITPR